MGKSGGKPTYGHFPSGSQLKGSSFLGPRSSFPPDGALNTCFLIDFRLAQCLLLQEVNVTIISNEVCINSSWGNQINRSAFTISRVYRFSFPIFLLSAHVCAIDASATGKDSCRGDSGGPLFLLENGRYIHTH